jgi:hypothetical protein
MKVLGNVVVAPRIQYMKVSDKFRNLAAVFPGKEHLASLRCDVQWA